VANTPSPAIQRIIASPGNKLTQPGLLHGGPAGVVYFAWSGRFNVVATDAIGRIYPLFRLPSSAMAVEILLTNPSGAVNVTGFELGLYRAGDWSLEDQAEVDSNCFLSGIDLGTVGRRSLAMEFGSGNVFSGFGTGPWRPGTEFDVCLTATDEPAPVASVQVAVGMLYVVGI
jgi:hypothetical protein